jgi:divinyl protochlorophyllide a 8-vinyl-reductase
MDSVTGDALIGPNAVIQLGDVLAALGGTKQRSVFSTAGILPYLTSPPASMIREAEVFSLFQTVWLQFPETKALAIMYEAGNKTGDYILHHRIPGAAQKVLKALPARLAIPLLLTAIQKHAWTFAGSGSVKIKRCGQASISICDNPLALPGCPWHLGVFEALFRRLTDRYLVFKHTHCCAKGDDVCRFEISRQMVLRNPNNSFEMRVET